MLLSFFACDLSVCYINHIFLAVSHLLAIYSIQLHPYTKPCTLKWHTLDHTCSLDNLVRGLQILHNLKKAWKIPITQSYTVFPWSVHPGFKSKLNKLLSNYATQTQTRPLDPYRTPAAELKHEAHPPFKKQNRTFHMNISIVWLHGPRVPWSQDHKI